jgi:hypothetical protein
MGMYPKSDAINRPPLKTFEKDAHTPGWGMEQVSANEAAERAQANVRATEDRSRIPFRGPLKNAKQRSA